MRPGHARRQPFLRVASLSIVATVCAAHDVASSENKYVFSADASAVDKAGKPLYVKDATIESTIEELKGAGKRLGTCAHSMTIPPALSIDFPPVVTSAHRARTRMLNCNFNNRDALFDKTGSLTCSVSSAASVYFDNDANDYFFLGPGTSLDEAIGVRRALRQGAVRLVGAIPNDHRIDSRTVEVTRIRDQFVVRFAGCGCDGGLRLAPTKQGNTKHFAATFEPTSICE